MEVQTLTAMSQAPWRHKATVKEVYFLIVKSGYRCVRDVRKQRHGLIENIGSTNTNMTNYKYCH